MAILILILILEQIQLKKYLKVPSETSELWTCKFALFLGHPKLSLHTSYI
jgi:hypothetical protein